MYFLKNNKLTNKKTCQNKMTTTNKYIKKLFGT